MFEKPKCLSSYRYYAFETTMKKKVLAVNVRQYKHSYLQQDELKKSDKEMLAIKTYNSIFKNCSTVSTLDKFLPRGCYLGILI